MRSPRLHYNRLIGRKNALIFNQAMQIAVLSPIQQGLA
jgi:hypothetical protein